MTNSPDSEYRRGQKPSTEIEQKVGENQGQAIAQMIGGIAVGQLTVYLSQTANESIPTTITKPSALGANPYKGLKSFYEGDGDRFFGRDDEIKNLLKNFQELHDRPDAIRVLPIYGPSGSGKSSLARAGLIPALGKHPLSGKERCRVVSLTPGPRPLEALANVLARIMTNDPSPVEKTEEFERVLKKQNDKQKFEGLRRIASALPDISSSPLIILVDQFEEVYTYQSQQDLDGNNDRKAFVESLLCAASDRSQHVSVILTLRSDFLGKTQQNPQLNKLFAKPGVLVAMMQPEQLAIAITEPAKRAGYAIDKATVNLLIKESQGQEGTLPLLQFALTQIWEGLLQEPQVTPADTLEKIGGVGGALASEAKRLYESLTSEQQQIARSAFLSMLHLHVDRNNDRRVTRRRSTISEIMRDTYSEQAVRGVIECFAKPGVWILVTSSDKKGKEEIEMVEIAHEALINNWKELEGWLDLQWESILQKRRIEDAALSWKTSQGYLWEGRMLRDAKEFDQSHKENTETFLSADAKEFVKASTKKERNKNLKLASIFLAFPIIGTLILVHFQILARANAILSRNDCKPDPEIKTLLEYMWWTKSAERLRNLNLCNKDLKEINLPNIKMQEVDFKNAKLSNSNFNSSSLPESDFRGSFSAYTNFSEAFLIGADFRCFKNQCSELIGVNFSHAKLMSAKFQNASLENVNFSNANLTKANFEGVKNLKSVEIEKAILCETTLPKYIKISGDRDCAKSNNPERL
jgi:uncharacterized protein YjbI with pentapeptide repeats